MPKPNWRDPNMPVIRNHQMRDGRIIEEVDPDYERRYRQHMVETSDQPIWKDDPTYNSKRNPK